LKFQREQQFPAAGLGSITHPVSVHNEWDQLREVIVGSIDGARLPDWHSSVEAVIPAQHHEFFRGRSGTAFPIADVIAAQRELDGLASYLERQGIVVRRPEEVSLTIPISTPFFRVSGGMYHAMPRDSVLIVGNTIIEAPMSWRNRYFETFAFKKLFKEYSRNGARWIAAPKPSLGDETYVSNRSHAGTDFAVSEFEPVFDAADFLRLDNIIVGQLSHVTNWSGVRWLQQILGPEIQIKIFRFDEPAPMHIDTTLLPLGPGKLMINSDWVKEVPDIFSDWEVRSAPRPIVDNSHPLFLSSAWLSMNVLVLDERHVLVEKEDKGMIRALAEWGFEPIPLPFKHVQSFGGSFHCATLDIRRGSD